VLLVERDRPGGDCLWTGCVPSKSLLAAAAAAASARSASRLGVTVRQVEVDLPEVMAHVRAAVAHIAPVDSFASMEAAGVHVLAGHAVFTGRGTLTVDGYPVRFVQALLATGAAPSVPPIPGLAGSGYLTSETIWGLDALPQDLVVLGGGSIGCELGQAFARLGAKVTVVEDAPRILPGEDADASQLVADAMTADGVRLLVGRTVGVVRPGPGATGELRLDDGSTVPYGCLLVAVGRTPRTRGLGLEAAGVDTDEQGFVVVDDLLRTTNRRVWAAGDLTGHPQFTHVAGVHASLAASNAVLGLRRKVRLEAVPRVTFTQPELAAVGASTATPARGTRVIDWRHTHVDRAVAEADTAGFARLVADRRGRIRGATVVGPRAGESVGELTVAVKLRLRTRDLVGVIHPYPTYNDGAWNAAIADRQAQLEAPAVRGAAAVLRRVRRLSWRR
jgi:pyruvate/2-oxoglutarate dehydrogenase complex dihydrolipoamide dehydrogenase (E3) component